MELMVKMEMELFLLNSTTQTKDGSMLGKLFSMELNPPLNVLFYMMTVTIKDNNQKYVKISLYMDPLDSNLNLYLFLEELLPQYMILITGEVDMPNLPKVLIVFLALNMTISMLKLNCYNLNITSKFPNMLIKNPKT